MHLCCMCLGMCVNASVCMFLSVRVVCVYVSCMNVDGEMSKARKVKPIQIDP